MSARTPFGVALDELAAELAAMGANDTLQGEDWVHLVIDAFVVTPHVWPIGHTMYEALLGWAGFDLLDAEGLHAAAMVTGFLDGLGCCPLFCDHDRPSALCEALAGPAAGQGRDEGAAARHGARFVLLLASRDYRSGPLGLSDAA